jgi:MFS family permease
MGRNGKLLGIEKNVFITGIVSLFMDMSSEMIYPLVPLFLSNVLGVSKATIGLIEGIAESTASILRVFSGWLSDKAGKRKGLMTGGYATSSLSRLILALAASWHYVLAFRFVDRLGKGIRGAPRDALVADSVSEARLGRAFGFQRSMDTAGAVIGPLLAFFLLGRFSNNFRLVFWLSIIPGIIAVLLIIFFIREARRAPARSPGNPGPAFRLFDGRTRFFLFIVTLFSIGNSSDVFLVLRAQQTGIPTGTIPLVYMLFNIIYAVTSIPAGYISDRIGKEGVILSGFLLFSIVYYGFASASDPGTIWALFGIYGFYMGFTDGIQRALLASIVPPQFKATAFGVYHTCMGIALFPASLIGGWLWDRFSPSATFYYGMGTSLLSSALLIIFMIANRRKKGPHGFG